MEAERLLGGRVAGVGPDVVERARAAFRRARELKDAPAKAVRDAAKKAETAIVDAVKEARTFGSDAWTALGQGAGDLWKDVQAHVLGPVVFLVVLYVLAKRS